MAAVVAVAAVTARCPLCGASILSISRNGQVSDEHLHPVPLRRGGSPLEGYMLCEECAVLAELPRDLPLN